MRFALLMAAVDNFDSPLFDKVVKGFKQVSKEITSNSNHYYTVDFDGKHYASKECQLDMLRHKKGF